MDVFLAIVTALAAVVFGLYAYDMVISLAGFLPMRQPRAQDQNTRFAVVICAHNEESVIGGVVASLLAQDYPKENVQIFVVADNCTDETARRAREAGATVLARSHKTHRTKGYALQFGMEHVLKQATFDAFCVFDADNHVAPDFLATMNGYLAEGHVAIQGYLDTKNPTETWVTRCIALAYYVTNRFWMRARARLGLAATLGGTGFCLSADILRKYRWDPGSLADDLELTMKLILDGVRVSYCPHTRTFDEKPTSLLQSMRQRTRWMQGHNDVAFRFVWPVAKKTVTGHSLLCFDALLHLLQPVRMLLAFLMLVALGCARVIEPTHAALDHVFWFTLPAIALAGAVFVLYPLIVITAERKLWSALPAYPIFLLYSFTWIPAAALGLLRVRRRVWIHTSHGPGKQKQLPTPGKDT